MTKTVRCVDCDTAKAEIEESGVLEVVSCNPIRTFDESGNEVIQVDENGYELCELEFKVKI
ncbi:hypothetical protein RN22_15330 [Grimontia sp. AD028]|uniref:hypothetical protein n=1 Tax=Grimontia TaxID=246861 RepID=UPI0005876D2A|nr:MULTISPECIES: hypothetical protein [Grimontia]KKD59549.1 hypothetical protein RN22_15330 [Grimontia sp. AD028]